MNGLAVDAKSVGEKLAIAWMNWLKIWGGGGGGAGSNEPALTGKIVMFVGWSAATGR